MEQLSQDAVRQLLARSRNHAADGLDAGRKAPRQWVSPAIAPAAVRVEPGIERRLVRRAEALWARLAGDAPLPSATLAGELLRPPFAAQSLLVEIPAGAACALPFVGDTLALLTGLSAGPADDAAVGTWLGGRLLSLARRAATLGEPCLYDSDDDRAAPAPDGADSQLLMRAIALPLSGVRSGATGATAVVVASWRKLLSAEETSALHRELAAAIDWMHRQGSQEGPGRE